MNNWILMFLPMGLIVLAAQLKNKDLNDTGADDEIARIMTELAPVMPQLIAGRVDENAADKIFQTVHAISTSYLRNRGKLPAA